MRLFSRQESSPKNNHYFISKYINQKVPLKFGSIFLQGFCSALNIFVMAANLLTYKTLRPPPVRMQTLAASDLRASGRSHSATVQTTCGWTFDPVKWINQHLHLRTSILKRVMKTQPPASCVGRQRLDEATYRKESYKVLIYLCASNTHANQQMLA